MDPIKNFLNQNRSDQIYKVEQLGTNISTGYSLFKAVQGAIGFVIFGLFFIIFVKIYWLGLLSIIVGVALPFLSYANRKREMASLATSQAKAEATQTPTTAVVVPADETVVDHVAGVMATGMRAATLVIGSAGARSAPENCIILTNKNIWFVYVPLPGANVITEHTDMAGADWLLAQKDIESKFQSLFSEGGLSALVNTNVKNFSIPLNELNQVSFSMMGNIVFTNMGGKEFTYGVRQAEDRERLKQLFASYLK
jgi:hypothetical protein